MSLLLLAPPLDWGDALIERLISQGDEVRVVEPDRERADRWRRLGAHVASGAVDDADLVERAGHGCRTGILVAPGSGESSASEILSALTAASIDRVVVIAAEEDTSMLSQLRSQGLDYVYLRAPGKRFRRRSLPAGVIAEAIDAADDLAGHPHLELDLSQPGAASALRLGSR